MITVFDYSAADSKVRQIDAGINNILSGVAREFAGILDADELMCLKVELAKTLSEHTDIIREKSSKIVKEYRADRMIDYQVARHG